MKSSAGKAAKNREVVPLFGPPPTVPTLVSLKWLCDVWMHGELKLMRLRTAMHADPNAPQPACGDPRGGKYLSGRPLAGVDQQARLLAQGRGGSVMAATGPTASGLPTVVLGGMASDMFVSVAELAAHAGYSSIGELLADIERGDAPALPYTYRFGGQRHCDRLLAQGWLDDLARVRDKAPERAAARAAREAQEVKDAQARQHAREQAAIAASRERQAMFRQLEAEAQAREVAEQQAHAARPVIAPLKGVGP